MPLDHDTELAVARAIEASPAYREAYAVARQNTTGRLWLLGGYVARTYAKVLYGTDLPQKVDIDFLCEGLVKDVIAPAGWTVGRNRYKNPRMVSDQLLRIDLMPFTAENFPAIARRGMPLSLESVLARAPLTVQAIAYETDTHQVIGDTGIAAVQSQTVGVQDMEEATDLARELHWTADLLVVCKAASYGFRSVLPVAGTSPYL